MKKLSELQKVDFEFTTDNDQIITNGDNVKINFDDLFSLFGNQANIIADSNEYTEIKITDTTNKLQTIKFVKEKPGLSLQNAKKCH